MFQRIEDCSADTDCWMKENMLSTCKNDDKTEVALICSPHFLRKRGSVAVKIGDLSVVSSPCVRNLGVMFDSSMSMRDQVVNVCRSAYGELAGIGRIRQYLTPDATKTLIHGMVMSRLDYCNALLCGVFQTLMNYSRKYKILQARIITRTS